jgi:hypothetical protein
MIREVLVDRKRATQNVESDINGVTEFPWEPRLQMVASYMKKVEAKLTQSNGGVFTEANRVLSKLDYMFILKMFGITGHLPGSEWVIREMEESGIPMTADVYDQRLAVLTRWLTVRIDIYNRFVEHQGRDIAPKTYGIEWAARTRTPPFFPPNIAKLVHSILASMKEQGSLEYRQTTLDLLLRIAKETDNRKALEKILKLGYGVDLQFPDSEYSSDQFSSTGPSFSSSVVDSNTSTLQENQSSSSTTTEQTRMNVSAMNTLLTLFSEKGDLSKLLQIVDVLSHPIQGGQEVWTQFPFSPTSTSTSTLQRLEGHDEAWEVITVEKENRFQEEKEEEPVTLTEAMKREEKSGQRLDFFGRSSRSVSGSSGPNAGLRERRKNKMMDPTIVWPKLRVRPAEHFLPVQMTPHEIRSMVIDSLSFETGEAKVPRDPRDVRYTDEQFVTNSTSWRICIKACATQASLASSPEDRRAGITLGMFFLQRAVGEMKRRRSGFLEVWIRIAELTKDLRRQALEGETDEGKMKSKAAEVERLKTQLRGALQAPGMGITHFTVQPLVSVLKRVYRIRGDQGLSRWVDWRLKAIRGIMEDVKEFYLQEWEVLTGRKREEMVMSKEEKIALAEKREEEKREMAGSVPGPSPLPSVGLEFFTSPLARSLNLAWKSGAGAIELPDAQARHEKPGKTEVKQFVLSDHVKILKRNVEEVERLIKDLEGGEEGSSSSLEGVD